MRRRTSGVFLHLSSLPSPYGIGDMGKSAYMFADLLKGARQTYWQVLPLCRTEGAHGNSPYSSISAFAGNPLFIDPEDLVERGLLKEKDLEGLKGFPEDQVDYAAVSQAKKKVLDKAYASFDPLSDPAYGIFCEENSWWLDDMALFCALKTKMGGGVWNTWPEGIKNRDGSALKAVSEELADEINRHKFLEYIFACQWKALKKYCNENGVQVIGDLPIYVNYDSADVWSNQGLFKLNEEKVPYVVSGVPPDYFSATGQVWGNPVYNWDVMKANAFRWWVRRLAHNLRLYDLVRIDHFRGLVAYWEIPAGEETAVNGRWQEVPVREFLGAFLERFSLLPIIVEDLGLITPDVREIIREYDLPGMDVLLFAFGSDDPTHPYLPHNYVKNSVAYTSVHDTNTLRGWLDSETSPEMRDRLYRYIGREVAPDDLHWEMIRLVMMSCSDMVMVPMQDILGLDSGSRMNFPSKAEGNWIWRLKQDQVKKDVMDRFLELTRTYGRA